MSPTKPMLKPSAVQQSLGKRWCFRCQENKPMAGSKKLGNMYVCADCQKVKEAA